MESEEQQIAVSVPLFLRKLWKMVNDHEAEDVIGWNITGDGFVIYDQLHFITHLLPKYFKHNNMASFVRQLNFYGFHKVAGIDKDEIQFTHSCFLKDLPETLVFIKRKSMAPRKSADDAKHEEISGILSDVKDLKTKHALVDNELKLLKQENTALWNEVNNLRLKHAKQTKIINKIIHFLISYIHSHQTVLSKGKVPVGRINTQNLKTGPTLLEIDYHDDPKDVETERSQVSYTVTEPAESGAITYPSCELEDDPNTQPAERTLDEILDKVRANDNINIKPKTIPKYDAKKMQTHAAQNLQTSQLVDIDSGSSSSSSLMNEFLDTLKNRTAGSVNLYNPANRNRKMLNQKPIEYNILQNPKENLGLYLDSTQVELNSLQDLLKNLSSNELSNICNIIENEEIGKSKKDNTSNLTDSFTNDDPEINFEDNIELDNPDYLYSPLTEDFANLPLEGNASAEMVVPNNSNQYCTENIKAEILPDEYFTI